MERQFNADFDHWGITLPASDVAGRRRGKFVQSRWSIWYLFGSDEGGEYLDYYACHSMTNDRHVRVYADGRRQALTTTQDFRVCSEDPVEDARLEAEYCAESRRVQEMLEAKGFGG